MVGLMAGIRIVRGEDCKSSAALHPVIRHSQFAVGSRTGVDFYETNLDSPHDNEKREESSHEEA